MALTTNQLEAACRALCSALGEDANEVGHFDLDNLTLNVPRWQLYKRVVGPHEKIVQAIIVGYTTAP